MLRGDWLDPRRLPPTPTQLRVFEAYVRTGSQKEAAHVCGMSYQTAKNHMTALYARIGASGAIDALRKLTWIVLPSDDPPLCGWVGACSRAHLHSGGHGEFRAL